MPKILIPTPLRQFTGKQDAVNVPGATVGEALSALTAQHPDLRRQIFTDEGKVRSFVNVYLNDEDIRYLSKDATAVKDGDTISLVPSIAGGSALATPAEVEPLSKDEILRYSRHLIMPEVGMEGQQKLKAAKVLLIGAGGLGSPLACISPPRAWAASAWSISTWSTSPTCSARSSTPPPTSAAKSWIRPPPRCRPSTPRRDRQARDRALQRERPRHPQGLRHRRRRHRQFPHPLPGQRRLRAARQAQRLRLDLPLRGPGHRLRLAGRPLLPLPLSRAAAARPGAQLRRRRRARHSARHHRADPGHRNGQADPGHRRAAGRPPAALRRARHDASAS